MRYKEYKKVDVPWLDEVPSHWELARLKNYITSINGYAFSSSDFRDFGIRVIRISDFNESGFVDDSIVRVDEKYYNKLKKFQAKNKDIILCLTGGTVGKYYFVDNIQEPMLINQRVGIIRNKDSMDSKFLKYLVSSNIVQTIVDFSKNSLNDNISLDVIERIKVPIPPKEEQEQITRFLDWKINEIDRLIEIYIKKISRLNDLKDLMISNYIFNGINRNIKFKKVGLSYIDQIPENWELEKIKFNFEIVKSIAGKEGYNVLSITQQGITIKDISKNEGQMASDYSKYQFVEVGDFAMNHMDLLTGYIDISKYFGVTSPDYRVFRIKNKLKIYDKYYLLMFQYFYKSRIFYKLGQGASHMGRWRLPADNFLNMKIPVPSYKDQVKIVDSINSKSDILNHQIERLKSIVFSLKNLKQSLISDAITGRIDVRNVHIPNYEKDDDIEDDAVLEENFEEEEV